MWKHCYRFGFAVVLVILEPMSISFWIDPRADDPRFVSQFVYRTLYDWFEAENKMKRRVSNGVGSSESMEWCGSTRNVPRRIYSVRRHVPSLQGDRKSVV